jgi:UDP-N-acetyl-D-glucosamine dehydrogenase
MFEDKLMELQELIASRRARVGVIGLGYVGLPLMSALHRAGFSVIGFDIDASKIDQLRRGDTYLRHLGGQFVSQMLEAGRFEATVEFQRLHEADAICICVPTPLGAHNEPDLSYIERTADDIARSLRPGQLIILESTTYPGTTRDLLLPRLEASGLRCGRDFFLAFSPEREDPGNLTHDRLSVSKLVGGVDPASTTLATDLYRHAFTNVVPVSSAEIAESAKLLENIYRAVNIALVNEVKLILTEMDIDVWEVIKAASTKPFGFQAFYPGPGLGGHCIPIDPFYLAWKAREVGVPTRFIELAGEINRGMPDYVVRRTALALNDRRKSLRESAVLILGVAYKPNIDDVRESPGIEVIEKLSRLGAKVAYNDPHVPRTPKMRRHDLGLVSVALDPESLQKYDCVIIVTNHEAYDWKMIADNAKLIVDTRNALAGVKSECTGHIVQA